MLLFTRGLFMLLPRSPGIGVNVQGDPNHNGVTKMKMLTASAYHNASFGNSAINNASQCTDLIYGTTLPRVI